MLDDETTPTARHFIRNNGIPPTNVDPSSWTLAVDGEVKEPVTLTIEELKKKFEVVTLQLQLECGGNGRSFFDPKAKGTGEFVDAHPSIKVLALSFLILVGVVLIGEGRIAGPM